MRAGADLAVGACQPGVDDALEHRVVGIALDEDGAQDRLQLPGAGQFGLQGENALQPQHFADADRDAGLPQIGQQVVESDRIGHAGACGFGQASGRYAHSARCACAVTAAPAGRRGP